MATNKSILIADDDLGIRDLLETILKEEGYELMYADDGHQAIELAHQKRPDMVLLDVVLPKMDGFEVCRRLREFPELADVPILMLTACGTPMDQKKGLQSGADDYIIKPFEPEEIKEHVAALFLKRERERGD